MTPDRYVDAEPVLLSKKSVNQIAGTVAKNLEYRSAKDIDDIVKNLGGRIIVKDTLTEDPEASGSLFVDSENSFTIYLPAHIGPLRNRFTIAHELGHYILHYLWPKNVMKREMVPLRALRKGTERVEWEANWFASGFLMPEEDFRREFHKNPSIDALAELFQVSRTAAEIRAKSLDLIA